MKPRELLAKVLTDPARREVADAIVLFADVMDSATISDIFDLLDYDTKFLSEFQRVAAETVRENVCMSDDEHFVDCSVRGDELCLIMSGGDAKTDIRVALTVAARLKAAFLACPINRERLAHGRNFFDIGIGIHSGHVTLGLRENLLTVSGEQPKPTLKPEGYTINLAKRVESLSREGMFSHITVSGDAKTLIEDAGLQMAFHDMGQVVCKGILHRSPVYEVKSPIHLEESWPARIIQNDNELKAFLDAVKVNRTSLWLIMALAHYYFDKEDYRQARQYYERALRIEPEYAVPKLYLGRTLYRIANLASADSRQVSLQQAREFLDQAVRSASQLSVTAHDFLAVVCRRLQRYADAIQHHRTALGVSPNSVWARNALAYTIAEAKIARHEVNLSEAEALAEELHQDSKFAKPYDYLLYHTTGLVCIAKHTRKDLDQAVNDLKKAEDACSKILSPKKKGEKLSEIQYHKAVALHERTTVSTDVGEEDLHEAEDELEKAITTFANLDVGDGEPYWAADAKRRMGEIHLLLNRLKKTQSHRNTEQSALDVRPPTGGGRS